MRGEEVRRRVRPRRTIACKGLVVASVFAFACLRLMAFCGAEAYSLSLDGKALLELKALISRDPGGVLSDWKDGGRGPCSWTGVTCDAALNRVVALNISGGLSCQAGGFSSSSSAFGEGNNGYSASASAASCARFLQVHSPGTGFPGGCAGAGAFPESVPAIGAPLGSEICLRNGSASNSSAGYNSGGDRVACRLIGKLPPSIGNLTELRVLSLPYNAFYGEIPGELGRLRVLEVLELQGNSLTGGVPSELGELNSLRVLNLGYNSLVGTIPETLGRCRSLETLNLAGNMLKGTIPPVLGSLLRLRLLSLSFNQLSGPIRVELFGSCQLLEHLHLSGNLLTGTIPAQLGNCPSLRSVSLFSNFLQESIPRELGRLSLLETLDVSRNILSGEIPKELGNCLRLSVLVLTNLLDYDLSGNYTAIDPASGLSNNEKGEFNYFEGDVPASVLMLPRLQILWAPRATLNGPLPEDWGDCHSLQILNLGQNLLSGEIPAGLGQCKSLIFLDLSSNRLEGSIPNLPISCMLYFNVSGNSLSGNISNSVKFDCPGHPLFAAHGGLLDISQAEVDPAFLYSSLFYCGTRASSPLASFVSEGLMVFHDLSRNNFTNHLPPPLVGDRLMKEQPSYGLFLNNNHFIGNISSPFFASCQGFQSLSLNLSGNQISGEIPAQVLGDCKSLKLLDAAFNHITGSVPSTLGNLSSLQYLDLSINDLQGSIPPQLGQLKDLQYLVLAENNMSGAIPEELGQLTSLVVLDLSSNALTGKIPEDLVKLRQLKGLFLEKNQLSGQIPGGFENLTALAMFNLSFNNLSGRIPHMGKSVTCDSFKGNNFLQPCQSASSSSHQQEQTRGPLPYASPPAASSSEGHGRFNSIEIAALTSAAAIIFVLAVLVVLFQYTRRCIPNPPGYQGGRKEVVTFTNIGVQLSYEHVVRATGNFSIGNLIGNGGFGATYKAELTPGLLVAVKRLSIGKFQGIQQFDTEIRTLGRIRHPNLVTLIGYHASESEMFLIYNYLPGGNLESFIHEKSTRNADWCILHKIALDIAQALAYLHDECVPRVLHRDIKPSNILLDNNLNAYLSDFGLARLLGASETHATTDVAGTFGYLAPEYAMTCRVSDKADVYSYGVVLLELLSGKKALDPSFSCYGNGFNIVAWACMLLRDGRARELYTPGLWDVGPHDDLVEALHLAVTCTVDSLSIRPLMRQVVQRLKQIQPPPVS